MRNRVGLGLGVALRATAMPVALGLRWARHGFGDPEPGIPPPEWNLRLISKVALDDFFFMSELASATLVSLRNRARMASEIETAVDFYRDHGWLDQPAAYHRTPDSLVSASEADGAWAFGSYRHLTFESGYEPFVDEPGRDRWLGYEANRIAHAWLLEHPGAPRPWIVCVPGYRMGRPMVDFAGFKARWLHEELGLNVAVPVMPLHGPRAIGRRGGDGYLTGDFIDTVHAQAQAVWDIRKLIGWLRARGAPAVGVHGVSLGGYTSALLASLDAKLDCVICGIPATDFLRLLTCHLPKSALRLAGRLQFPFESLRSLLQVVSPLAMQPLVPSDRRFLYAGTVDTLAQPGHAHDLWHHWGRPRLAWFQGGHISFLWEPEVKALIEEALVSGGLIARARERRSQSAPNR